MTVHVIMPARPSHVPGQWVRTCTRCEWVRHHPDRDQLDRLAEQHREDAPTARAVIVGDHVETSRATETRPDGTAVETVEWVG